MAAFDAAPVKTTSIIALGRLFSTPVEQLYLQKMAEKKNSYIKRKR